MIPEFTNMKDRTGSNLYVGDRVRKEWGIWGGQRRFEDHTITVEQKGNVRTYKLGSYWNLWNGTDVEKIEGYYESGS